VPARAHRFCHVLNSASLALLEHPPRHLLGIDQRHLYTKIHKQQTVPKSPVTPKELFIQSIRHSVLLSVLTVCPYFTMAQDQFISLNAKLGKLFEAIMLTG
jgi:hypothetical protein